MTRPFPIAALAFALALSAPAARAVSVDIYAVCGLDPNGDNFLALRAGPSSNTPMLRKLGPGTRVEDWGRRGNWMQVDVQAPGRTTGWVYTGYLCLVEDH